MEGRTVEEPDMDNVIQIKNRKIGTGYPAYMIAEMSANHAGSLRRAKDIIYAAKESGADDAYCMKGTVLSTLASIVTIPFVGLFL